MELKHNDGFDELRRLNKVLRDLLDDPEPGMYGWIVSMANAIKGIAAAGGYKIEGE